MSFDTLGLDNNPLRDLKHFFKANGIITSNNFGRDDSVFDQNKFQLLKNIFETEKANDVNDNLLFDDEKYYIKTSLNTENNNGNAIKNKKVNRIRNKNFKGKEYFLTEKVDKKKKNMGRRRPKIKYKTKPSHDKFNKDTCSMKIWEKESTSFPFYIKIPDFPAQNTNANTY